MLLVLSPSKTLDFETKPATSTHTQPEFLKDAEVLIKKLKGYTPPQLSELMGISDKLAALNVARYHDFATPFTPANARQALLAFKGDVYEPMGTASYSRKEFTFAQKHLRILSGLYGLLRPLDLIQPYRLEMGTRLPTAKAKDLYAFWSERITLAINRSLEESGDKVLVNLASEEYFKAVRPTKLAGESLNIIFKENQKGTLKIIGLFAKRARGLMADFIIKNQITDKNDLKDFTLAGYRFDASHSKALDWVFIR